MQRKIVPLLFLGSFSVFAADLDLGKNIESINRDLSRAGTIDSSCPNCVVSASAPAPGAMMKACVEAICPKQNFSSAEIFHRIYTRAAGTDPMYENEIAPLVEALAREKIKESLSNSLQYLEWLKNPVKIESPGTIRYFNLFQQMGDFDKFKITSEGGKNSIDAVGSRLTFPNLNEAEYGRKVKIANKLMEFFLDRAFPESDPTRILLFYPADKFKKRVADLLDSFEKKMEQIKKDPDSKFFTQLKSFEDLFLGKQLRKQLDSSEEINANLIDALNNMNSMANLFFAASTDPELKELLNSSPIDLKRKFQDMNVIKYTHENILKYQAILGQKKISSEKCKVVFAASQELLPSQKTLDAFKLKESEIKAKFLAKTKALVCDQGARNYQEAVEKWVAHIPYSRKKHQDLLVANLRIELEEAKRWPLENQEIEKSPFKDTLYAVSIAMDNSKPDEKSPTDAADDVCDNFMPNILPDATVYSSNGFVAGPIAVERAEAEGICDHELGHKLYDFLKTDSACLTKNEFKKIRLCLVNQHLELPIPERAQQSSLFMSGGEAKFESEDWADLVSAQVDDPENNFACFFTRQLDDSQYDSLSLKNEDETDTHSSNLFRLLHLNFLKTGKTPQVCEQALAAKGERAGFTNCLAPSPPSMGARQ